MEIGNSLSSSLPIQSALVVKVKDELFEVDHLSQFELCLQLDKSNFRFCIIDSKNNRCLLLEEYNIGGKDDEVLDNLSNLFEEHSVLKAGFWKSVKLCIKNRNFTLVPVPFFKKENLKEYLQYNSLINEKEEALYYFKHILLDSANIFSAPNKLVNWFKEQYPTQNIQVIHQTSSFIEGILRYHDHSDKKTMFILAEDHNLTILVTQDKNLLYCNQFHYKNSDEFLFYIVFVFSELHLQQNGSKVVIFGDLNYDSKVVDKLYKYFNQTSFGSKPPTLKFGFPFDELADHKYFDLYSTYLCQ